MKLSVGTNFDSELIQQLSGTAVTTVFGKLTQDIIGGGRPSFALPQVDETRLQDHIKLAHQHGIEFNYLLNAQCLDNLEVTRQKNCEILQFLDRLQQWNVDSVTVSIPYLILLVKERLPKVKLSISTFSNVDSIQKAKYYEDLGVNEITLPESCNRDFDLLENLKKEVKVNLQLIATNDCLLNCPFRHHHPLFQSHASQSDHVSHGFAFDFCLLKCTYERLKDPSQFIKSPWIRPEDLKSYEDLGFEQFKITERMKKTDRLLKVIQAYQNRSFDGNLAELLNVRMSENDFITPNFEYNNHPIFIDSVKMSLIYRLLFSNNVFIDNQKLSGFINFFINNKIDCSKRSCAKCQHCQRFTNASVTIDEKKKQASINEFKQLFKDLSDGSIFKTDEGFMFWSEEIKELFEKMIDAKPDFIRERARKSITREAEKFTKERNETEVSLSDLVRANYFDTPEDFRFLLVKGLAKMGIDIKDHVNESL